jgi:hypothetical protein
MSERHERIRTALVTFFPMFIATLSLVTAIFNGYLNNKFIDVIQRNVGRTEYMRTCKEAIDAYFQVKFRAGVVAAGAVGSAAASPGVPSAADVEAANAVAKFAALGTYLANLRDEAIRRRYTELSLLLEKTVAEARRTAPAELPKLFEPADAMFASLNDDCVKSAQAAPM